MARTYTTCLALVGSLLGLAPTAHVSSQPIYRCGNTYSQTPCANAIVVRAEDPRTPNQKAQTDAAALQAARLADQMERERLASEHRPAQASNRPAKGKPAQPSATTQAVARPSSPEAGSRAKSRSRSRPPAPEHFIATTRQDVQKKPATAPARERPANR